MWHFLLIVSQILLWGMLGCWAYFGLDLPLTSVKVLVGVYAPFVLLSQVGELILLKKKYTGANPSNTGN